jgi:hypothetical protein
MHPAGGERVVLRSDVSAGTVRQMRATCDGANRRLELAAHPARGDGSDAAVTEPLGPA